MLRGGEGAAAQRFEAFFSSFFLFPLPFHRGLFVETSSFEFFEKAFFRELTFQRLERFLDLILVNFDQSVSLHLKTKGRNKKPPVSKPSGGGSEKVTLLSLTLEGLSSVKILHR